MIGNLLTALGWVIRYLVPIGTLALAIIIFLLAREIYEFLLVMRGDLADIYNLIKKMDTGKKVSSTPKGVKKEDSNAK